MKKGKVKKTKDDEVNGQGEKGRVPRPYTGRNVHDLCNETFSHVWNDHYALNGMLTPFNSPQHSFSAASEQS